MDGFPAFNGAGPALVGLATDVTLVVGLLDAGLLAGAEVPAPEAAACLAFGPAASDFGLFDLILASTSARGLSTTGMWPRSSVGRQPPAAGDEPVVA